MADTVAMVQFLNRNPGRTDLLVWAQQQALSVVQLADGSFGFPKGFFMNYFAAHAGLENAKAMEEKLMEWIAEKGLDKIAPDMPECCN
jgi:hypothetical protein